MVDFSDKIRLVMYLGKNLYPYIKKKKPKKQCNYCEIIISCFLKEINSPLKI